MNSEIKRKPLLLRIGQFILDLFEIYIPVAAFSIMFIVFILQIFFRYFLNDPLTWPYEVTIFGFIWTTILGACYARRAREHVVFGIVYDKMKPRGQLVFRLLGNALICVGLIIAFGPTYNYIQFMAFQKSTVLKIPFDIAYSPYIVFSIIIIGRSAYDIFLDFRRLARGEV